MADELVGRVLEGRYEIVEPLAAGGMATVYRGRQLIDDHKLDSHTVLELPNSRGPRTSAAPSERDKKGWKGVEN